MPFFDTKQQDEAFYLTNLVSQEYGQNYVPGDKIDPITSLKETFISPVLLKYLELKMMYAAKDCDVLQWEETFGRAKFAFQLSTLDQIVRLAIENRKQICSRVLTDVLATFKLTSEQYGKLVCHAVLTRNHAAFNIMAEYAEMNAIDIRALYMCALVSGDHELLDTLIDNVPSLVADLLQLSIKYTNDAKQQDLSNQLTLKQIQLVQDLEQEMPLSSTVPPVESEYAFYEPQDMLSQMRQQLAEWSARIKAHRSADPNEQNLVTNRFLHNKNEVNVTTAQQLYVKFPFSYKDAQYTHGLSKLPRFSLRRLKLPV
ncbi:hypothetical protein MIR68_010956 [Amoeboaphelidium protococcarum]|nr:hypothetical protein MIR68_010956 [Amoeboaphelidium protococcarum]